VLAPYLPYVNTYLRHDSISSKMHGNIGRTKFLSLSLSLSLSLFLPLGSKERQCDWEVKIVLEIVSGKSREKESENDKRCI
jgi:hypothetical protein